MVIQAYKNIGETPLDVINRLKNDNPEYKHVPMTYAGRLDPMAEGLMIILTGDDCLKKDEYTNLSKDYEVRVLFGFETDTYDLLGIVNARSLVVSGRLAQADGPSRSKIQQDFMSADGNNMTSAFSNILKNFTGKVEQEYPPYSSRTVDGKPLWMWAREGRLDEITIPSHEVLISKIEMVDSTEISKQDLEKYIKESIAKIVGDFRQKEILDSWKQALIDSKEEKFICVNLAISCSSGTYVRVIAHELGKRLGIPALAMHIKRTKIGDYNI